MPTQLSFQSVSRFKVSVISPHRVARGGIEIPSTVIMQKYIIVIMLYTYKIRIYTKYTLSYGSICYLKLY